MAQIAMAGTPEVALVRTGGGACGADMIVPAIPSQEKERPASLRSLGLGDTPPEERFDALADMTSLLPADLTTSMKTN